MTRTGYQETIMKYGAAGRREHYPHRWAYSMEEVNRFASVMVDVGYITELDGLLEYFEKPHQWGREHFWWEENDRTDSDDRWAQGELDRFET